MPLLGGLAVLLICQLLGEAASVGLDLPVPGPVVGMALLFGWLVWRGGPAPGVRAASEGLLRHLSILYVPAGVGLMVHFQLIARDWLAILLALVVSTLLTLAVTALLLQRLRRSSDDAPSHEQ